MVIYKTTNLINGKIYIGQDSKNNSDYFGSGVMIKRAIKKYGKENFIKEIIDYAEDKNILDEKEIYWIDKFNAKDKNIGYNISNGGNGCLGCKQSEETKEKRRLKNIGELNPMYGKKLSEESLLKRTETVRKNKIFEGKNNPNFKYDINEKELYDYFITQNKTIKEISKIYSCSMDVINDNLKSFNIRKPKSNKYNLSISKILSYQNKGLNLVEIGKIFNCSNKIIHKFIKKHKNE
jgi:group I intron endonuclease